MLFCLQLTIAITEHLTYHCNTMVWGVINLSKLQFKPYYH
jgi:hypothetical protein